MILKLLLSLAAFLASFLFPLQLYATGPAKLQAVSAKRSAAGVQIDLAFDKPYSARALRPSYERNFVQLVLRSTKIDSAKILPIGDSEIQKVFTYPYSPDTTRVRIILKRDNHWAKGRVAISNASSKLVRVFVRDSSPTELASKASPVAAPAAVEPTEAIKVAMAQTPPPDAALEEKLLLKEVIGNTRDIDIQNPDSVKAALGRPVVSAIEKTEEKSENKAAEHKSLGTKSDPARHFLRMAAALFGILALFIGCVFLVRRYAVKLKTLPFGKKERLIQVVATHYLGNKKSISLVKVTGEYMVVGVSNDGISLISKLGPEVNVDRYLEDRFWGGTFEKHLDSYTKDATVAKEIDLSSEVPQLIAEKPKRKFLYDGPSDLEASSSEGKHKEDPLVVLAGRQVQDKIELSPVRASIKEKLTKLKPLA